MKKNTLAKSQVIAVSGGKGGIGKTFFSVNFAVELASFGNKVLIFDADINLSNVHLLLHIDENKNFKDFIDGQIKIEDVIQKGVGGVDVLYVGDELNHIYHLKEDEISRIYSDLVNLESYYDYIIVDTQAGLNELNVSLLSLADRIILITNPEITAIVDLYKTIKVVSLKAPGIQFEIVVNKCVSAQSGMDVFQKIENTVSQFRVRSKLFLLGFILADHERVLESIQKRVPIVLLHKNGNVKGCFKLVIDAFLKKEKKRKKISFLQNLLKH